MSDNPVEFLLPWQDIGVELTDEEVNSAAAIHQRLIEKAVDRRVADELG
jgi:hypothetical protein